jgi:hypothetical protein
VRGGRVYGARTVQLPPSNVDMLAWFEEDERGQCASCHEKACVSLPHAHASFCLACGAISLNGERIDVDRRIPT